MDLLIFITVSYRVKCINLSVLILKEEMILRGIKVFTFVLSTKKELDREINSIRRKPDCDDMYREVCDDCGHGLL